MRVSVEVQESISPCTGGVGTKGEKNRKRGKREKSRGKGCFNNYQHLEYLGNQERRLGKKSEERFEATRVPGNFAIG